MRLFLTKLLLCWTPQSCFADHPEADLLQEQSWHMNLHIPVLKQAHVVHVVDGFVLGHVDLGNMCQLGLEQILDKSCRASTILFEFRAIESRQVPNAF